MAFNTQEQEIIKFGAANGKSRAEVEQAIANYRSGVVPTPKVNKPEQSSSIVDGISRVATTYSNNLKEQVTGGINYGGEGLATQSENYSQALQTGNKLDQTKALLRGGLRVAGGEAQALLSPITAAIGTGIQGWKELDTATGGTATNQIKDIAQKNPEIISGISNYVAQNPEKVKDVQDLLNFIGGGIVSKESAALKTGLQDVTTGLKSTLSKTPKSIDGIPVSTMADEALHSGLQLKNDIQLSIAKKNVSPQLESSAGRLMSDTAQNVENPVVAYDKYLAQSKKSLGDIKVDAPISTVGGKIGDAFMKVVKQKQAVGATLGDELKSVGKLKVSVIEPKGTLLSELKDSGLSYNPRTNELTSFQGSKFAPEEVSMLNQYVKDVQKLGDTPSVSQIDNFISKTRSDLNFAKGKSGVTGTTNAERIIKGNLAGMRDSLNPSKNGLPQLSKYWNANKAYSELSDFVDEGAGFLGKTTQSGDFAKDASVAKSSVQSILNGGKKDWLIKLEGLTGYPALDESVLALQAMKDAGDFKGLSLLQAMQESGGIPTTKAGFTQKILDMAIAKGEKLIVGTPEEQTRALLQDLSVKNSTKASTPTINSSASPTGGTKIQSSKITNPSDIPAQSTPTTPKSKGIRGMVNPSELLPKKKVVSEPITVYRGEYNRKQDLDNAISTSLDKNVAKSFSEDGKIKEMVIDSNAKIIDISTLRKEILGVDKFPDPSTLTKEQFDAITGNKLINYAKNKGYDVIDYTKANIKSSGIRKGELLDEQEYKVINNKVLKEKSATTLEQEAKKYKSAEEFVKAQVNFNHASAGEIKSFLPNFPNQKPVFLSKDANYYKTHIGEKAKNTSVKVDLGKTIKLDEQTLTKILKNSDNTPKMFQDANSSARREVFNWLKINGYDSATLPKDWDSGTKYLESTVVFNPSKQIKTKSELIDIWNKNNK